MVFVISYRDIRCLFRVVDCMWDSWKIGPCSKTCGVGVRNVTRGKKIKADYGGKECSGLSIVSEMCNFRECPGQKKIFLPYIKITLVVLFFVVSYIKAVLNYS